MTKTPIMTIHNQNLIKITIQIISNNINFFIKSLHSLSTFKHKNIKASYQTKYHRKNNNMIKLYSNITIILFSLNNNFNVYINNKTHKHFKTKAYNNSQKKTNFNKILWINNFPLKMSPNLRQIKSKSNLIIENAYLSLQLKEKIIILLNRIILLSLSLKVILKQEK